jgi:lysozyme family protein
MQKTKATSARFLCYVSQTIGFETGGDKSGGYTHDPSDSGGETKWGISKRSHPTQNIKTLTYTQAVDIYKEQYWNELYDYIKSDSLAFKLFDMGVLSGQRKAILNLQKAIVACGYLVRCDGNFGPITLTATNIINEAILYGRYIKEYDTFFNRLVIKARKNKKYLRGWLIRLYWKWEIKE